MLIKKVAQDEEFANKLCVEEDVLSEIVYTRKFISNISEKIGKPILESNCDFVSPNISYGTMTNREVADMFSVCRKDILDRYVFSEV